MSAGAERGNKKKANRRKLALSQGELADTITIARALERVATELFQIGVECVAHGTRPQWIQVWSRPYSHVIRDHRRPADQDRIWEARIGSISHEDFQRQIRIERMRAALNLAQRGEQ